MTEELDLTSLPRINKVNRAILCGPHDFVRDGALCLSLHNLMLLSQEEDFLLLMKMIDLTRVLENNERRYAKNTGVTIELKTKTFVIYELTIPNADEAKLVETSISLLSKIEQVTYTFPFYYHASFDIVEDGWTAFSPVAEFGHCLGSGDWRVSSVNADYQVCPSYPREVIVPSGVSDDVLVESAKFRQNGRFPVLAYFHRERKTCLLRSGEPLVGNANPPRRSKGDEKLLNAALGPRNSGQIVDVRSPSAVKQSQSRGGGIEPDQHYPQWKKRASNMPSDSGYWYTPIDKYTALNESFQKFIEACQEGGPSPSANINAAGSASTPPPTLTPGASSNVGANTWLSKLRASNWLGQVKDVLTAASTVAYALDREFLTILVHGGDGWDRTLQVTALTQVILSPDCRTIRGFEALIDREFIQGGHPFGDRCKNSAFCISKQRYEGPVFLLFLDCVWQIWQQHPTSFQFTDNFLILLASHAYASEFGTFVCNNAKQRDLLKVASRTISLWSYINQPAVIAQYLNPLYVPCKADPELYACRPSCAAQSISVWQELYLQQIIDPKVIRSRRDQIKLIKEAHVDAMNRAVRMRRILCGLQKDAIEDGLLKSESTPDAKLATP